MSTEAIQEDRSPSYLPSEADAGESVRLIREGLPAEAFEWLKNELGLTVGTLGDIVHISRRTANRRKKEGRLKPDESERVLRLIRIYQRAAEVLGTREDAREWLQEENYALGEETPLQFADTEPGARRVRQLLGQIEHGIVS
jgi:putative toxin-antitoxin system antitoxin component (TIGR02293 family)